jgi:hypothetical protein
MLGATMPKEAYSDALSKVGVMKLQRAKYSIEAFKRGEVQVLSDLDVSVPCQQCILQGLCCSDDNRLP